MQKCLKFVLLAVCDYRKAHFLYGIHIDLESQENYLKYEMGGGQSSTYVRQLIIDRAALT